MLENYEENPGTGKPEFRNQSVSFLNTRTCTPGYQYVFIYLFRINHICILVLSLKLHPYYGYRPLSSPVSESEISKVYNIRL